MPGHVVNLRAAQFQLGAPPANAHPVMPTLQVAAPTTFVFGGITGTIVTQPGCAPCAKISRMHRHLVQWANPFEVEHQRYTKPGLLLYRP
jgi:hypothetical protein